MVGEYDKLDDRRSRNCQKMREGGDESGVENVQNREGSLVHIKFALCAWLGIKTHCIH